MKVCKWPAGLYKRKDKAMANEMMDAKDLKRYKIPFKKRKPCGLHCVKMNDISVRNGDDYIIKDINVHVHCGQLTAVIGRNGAGKSTLMKAMLGLIPHEGNIEFKDISNKKIIDNMKIGYVPQTLAVEKDTPVSVYDMFAGFLTNRPVFLPQSKKIRQMISEQLSLFEGESLIDKKVCDLSGGELQRVLLSLACAPAPDLLLLDEPVSGIDTTGRERFNHAIGMLKSNYDVAIIMISHDMDFVRKYADNVILLDKTILKTGKPEEVLESKEFVEIFGEKYVYV